VKESVGAKAEIEGREDEFRKKGKLKQKHVPTAANLAKIGFEIAEHDARVRNVEDRELGDALRMDDGDAPGDGSAPIVAG